MKSNTKEKVPTKREQVLEGLATGIGVTLIGGPIFIVAMAKGWLIWLLFVSLCIAFIFLAKKIIGKLDYLDSSGGGEFWWLGGLIGFCTVMLLLFISMALP